MEYTTNYHLPQWVETDRIMMEDFNQAMANLDAGLSSAKSVADSAKSIAEEGNEKIPSLEMRMDAVEQDIKFVKLGGPVTTNSANGTVTFDLSAITMTDYAALVVMAQGYTSSTMGTLDLYINNTVVTSLYSGSESHNAAMAWLQPHASMILGLSAYCTNKYTQSNLSGCISCQWASVKQIKISGASSAGMSCALYAIKA